MCSGDGVIDFREFEEAINKLGKRSDTVDYFGMSNQPKKAAVLRMELGQDTGEARAVCVRARCDGRGHAQGYAGCTGGTPSAPMAAASCTLILLHGRCVRAPASPCVPPSMCAPHVHVHV